MNTIDKILIKPLDKSPKANQSLWWISGKYCIVSKAELTNGEWETLIFPSDKEGKVVSWLEVFGTRGNIDITKTITEYNDSQKGD